MGAYYILENFTCPECEGSGEDEYGRVCHFCFGQKELWKDTKLESIAPWQEMERRQREIEELLRGWKGEL